MCVHEISCLLFALFLLDLKPELLPQTKVTKGARTLFFKNLKLT